MSLDWSLSKIEDYEDLCWKATGEMSEEGKPLYRLNPITESIIFACMPIDLGDITEDNYHEFYQRYAIWCAVKGLTPYFTLNDVRDHIGLKCNVANMTLHSWMTKRLKWFMETAQLDVKRLQREAKERHPVSKK